MTRSRRFQGRSARRARPALKLETAHLPFSCGFCLHFIHLLGSVASRPEFESAIELFLLSRVRISLSWESRICIADRGIVLSRVRIHLSCRIPFELDVELFKGPTAPLSRSPKPEKQRMLERLSFLRHSLRRNKKPDFAGKSGASQGSKLLILK